MVIHQVLIILVVVTCLGHVESRGCRVNEKHRACGPVCEGCGPRCQAISCPPGGKCYCIPRHSRFNGVCIPDEACPNKCGRNKEYSECASPCPETCIDSEDPFPIVCGETKCIKGCVCKRGFVLSKPGSKKCIPKRECPGGRGHQVCKENEVFKLCGSACPKTCTNRNAKIVCDRECIKGCFCRDGFVRNVKDGNKCIPPEECEAIHGLKLKEERMLAVSHSGSMTPHHGTERKRKRKLRDGATVEDEYLVQEDTYADANSRVFVDEFVGKDGKETDVVVAEADAEAGKFVKYTDIKTVTDDRGRKHTEVFKEVVPIKARAKASSGVIRQGEKNQ